MNIFDIKKQLSTNVFTTDMLKPILAKEYEQPIIKINSMIKKGQLIHLKRGVYALAQDYRDHPLNMISIANILHKPSYVSYEYALSYHGLIPERVYTITSATTYLSAKYSTELGNFSYKKISAKAYPLGLEWKFDTKDGGYMIATVEKALCDKVYDDSRAKNLKKDEIMHYLEDDLRIEWSDLQKLDTTLIWKISMAYSSKILRELAATIKKG